MSNNEFKEEGITRCLIYQEFIETDYYRDNLRGALSVIETQNAKIKTSRQFAGEKNIPIAPIKKYNSEINESIHHLNRLTGIPHNYTSDDNQYKMIYPVAIPKDLPIHIRYPTEDPPEMISLRFDITKGLQEQLNNAKKKLKSFREEWATKNGYSSEIYIKDTIIATSRQTIEDVLALIETVSLCDKEKREHKLNRVSVAKKFKIKVSTLNDRYKKGYQLIINRKIRKYFPEFKIK